EREPPIQTVTEQRSDPRGTSVGGLHGCGRVPSRNNRSCPLPVGTLPRQAYTTDCRSGGCGFESRPPRLKRPFYGAVFFSAIFRLYRGAVEGPRDFWGRECQSTRPTLQHQVEA